MLWFVLGCRAVRPCSVQSPLRGAPAAFHVAAVARGTVHVPVYPRARRRRVLQRWPRTRVGTREQAAEQARRGEEDAHRGIHARGGGAHEGVRSRQGPRRGHLRHRCRATPHTNADRHALARPRYHGAARCARGGGRGGGEATAGGGTTPGGGGKDAGASRRSPGNGRRVRLAQSHGFRREHPRGRGPKRHGPRAPRGAATGPGTIGGAQTPARGGGGGARRRRRALLGRGQRVGSKRHARAGHHPRALGRDTRQPARRGEDRVARRAAGWRGLRAPVGQVQGQVSSRVRQLPLFVRAKGGGRTQRRRQARKGLARGGGDAFQG